MFVPHHNFVVCEMLSQRDSVIPSGLTSNLILEVTHFGLVCSYHERLTTSADKEQNQNHTICSCHLPCNLVINYLRVS